MVCARGPWGLETRARGRGAWGWRQAPGVCMWGAWGWRPGPGVCPQGAWGWRADPQCRPRLLSLAALPQGQVQSGLRSGIRIAQGSYFRVTLLKATPVQVDGEPWVQAPGHLIISAAGPKVHQSGFGSGLVTGGQSSHGWFFSDPERSQGRIRRPALSHHSVPLHETG